MPRPESSNALAQRVIMFRLQLNYRHCHNQPVTAMELRDAIEYFGLKRKVVDSAIWPLVGVKVIKTKTDDGVTAYYLNPERLRVTVYRSPTAEIICHLG
jgi:hypothetical protein